MCDITRDLLLLFKLTILFVSFEWLLISFFFPFVLRCLFFTFHSQAETSSSSVDSEAQHNIPDIRLPRGLCQMVLLKWSNLLFRQDWRIYSLQLRVSIFSTDFQFFILLLDILTDKFSNIFIPFISLFRDL